MKRTLYETNYERLLPLLTALKDTNHKHFSSDGYMDLVVEKIGPDEYSLCHYSSKTAI